MKKVDDVKVTEPVSEDLGITFKDDSEAIARETSAINAIHNELKNEDLGYYLNKNPYPATVYFKDGNTLKISPGGTTRALVNRALVSKTDVRVLFSPKK